MAYENFKPEIWSAAILMEKMNHTTFAPDCNHAFTGDVKLGWKVYINTVTVPEIFKYDQKTGLGDPDKGDSTRQMLEITEADAYQYMIDDIDAAQIKGDLSGSLKKGISRKLAEKEDKFIAKVCATEATNLSDSTQISSTKTAKAAIDGAFETLWAKHVTTKDDVTIYLPPWFYLKFQDELINLKTNNDDLIKKGVMGMYYNAKVKISSDLHNDGTDDYIIVKTNTACAFADGLEQNEALRSQKYFSDVLRGLHCYGAKVVLPEELYIIKAHK